VKCVRDSHTAEYCILIDTDVVNKELKLRFILCVVVNIALVFPCVQSMDFINNEFEKQLDFNLELLMT